MQRNLAGTVGRRNSDMPLHYPIEQQPEAGATIDVLPGLRWVRMPLPFALDHINLWLIEDGLGESDLPLWTAVDTGVAVDDIRNCWRRLLPDHPLRRQIVTHCHPDHLGLAAWLERETGAPLTITLGEYTTAQMIHAQIGGFGIAAMLELFRHHGLEESWLEALALRGNVYKQVVPEIPATYRRLFPDEDIAIGDHTWRVIIGYGHAPEHAALHCEELRILISGDMLLPRISTNMSVVAPNPDGNPLGLFLDSIAGFKTLPADTLVLPSHGRPFRGLHERIAELEAHHRDRCADLLAACAAPKSAAELIPVLFPREIKDPHQIMFAMGEAMAHLNYLEQAGALSRSIDSGCTRFIASP
ncbi:metallo-beta-lactamase superfamily protein [mine drainage metagenome]|uniref:Metallo-beta-lactamase superfamily protein n=1 Tax=mine drainage metagenome TaxID=410659 RepID=A0A1J5R619_9ZZZZ